MDELVPKYLPSVPQKTAGREISYFQVSEKQFYLKINESNGRTYSGTCTFSDIEEPEKN